MGIIFSIDKIYAYGLNTTIGYDLVIYTLMCYVTSQYIVIVYYFFVQYSLILAFSMHFLNTILMHMLYIFRSYSNNTEWNCFL